jgi:hypothetical protein
MPDLFGHPELNGWHESFLQFKATYPRRQAWIPAEKAFRRLFLANQLPPISELLDAITWQKEAGCLMPRTAADGRDVRPLPASWLNAARWTDERIPTQREAMEALNLVQRTNINDLTIAQIDFVLRNAELRPEFMVKLQQRKLALQRER